jgi:hypothetical protein
MRARSAAASLALAATMLIPAVASADGESTSHHHHGDGHQAVEIVRRATAGYRHVGAAEAAGYGQFLTCVQEPGQGAMGTHWVNGALVGDSTLDPTQPEALMYETKRSGKMELVGVEYIVFQDVWDAENSSAPMLFDEMFHLVSSPNRYGLPPFYALHVWAWKHNPDGTFADWNPRVSCEHAAGTPI